MYGLIGINPAIQDKEQQAEDISQQLLGSCEQMAEEVKDDPDLCQMIDERVRECDTCGWWVETHEVDDDGDCTDCQTGEK